MKRLATLLASALLAFSALAATSVDDDKTGIPTGGGGSGTVTSVGAIGANGIGISGSPVTTAGSVTFSLGDITPTTVNTGTATATRFNGPGTGLTGTAASLSVGTATYSTTAGTATNAIGAITPTTVTTGTVTGTRLISSIGAVGSGSPVISSSSWNFYNSSTSGGTVVLAGVLKVEGGGMKLRAADALGWATNNTADNLTLHAGISSSGAGVVDVTNGQSVADGGALRDLKSRNLLAGGGNGSYVQVPAMTVANLAVCAAGTQGARAVATDANATTFLSTVAGGGANKVPVVCDGTNWVIGEARMPASNDAIFNQRHYG